MRSPDQAGKSVVQRGLWFEEFEIGEGTTEVQLMLIARQVGL